MSLMRIKFAINIIPPTASRLTIHRSGTGGGDRGGQGTCQRIRAQTRRRQAAADGASAPPRPAMPRSSPTSRQRGDEARIAADVAECGEPGSVPLPAIERHRRRRVLWAEQGPYGLALVAADAAQRDVIGAASAGYVGVSDGWQDFAVHGALTWEYDRAGLASIDNMIALLAIS